MVFFPTAYYWSNIPWKLTTAISPVIFFIVDVEQSADVIGKDSLYPTVKIEEKQFVSRDVFTKIHSILMHEWNDEQ